jgi:carboxypeptidase family protein
MVGLLACILVAGISASAQRPTGEIFGTVLDPSGAVVPQAGITATNRETALERETESNEGGTFSITHLLPGSYEVTATASGFGASSASIQVETGRISSLVFELPLATVHSSVEASTIAPLLDYQQHGVDGVVSRTQIENLPLNGREFLQLSLLEPGVTAGPADGFYTPHFNLSVMGSPAAANRITVDGGSIHSPVTGSAAQGFSQEVVDEFQISTVNFDVSTGLTNAGAINVVTRSGGNDFHGAGFFFYRDNHLAAYPGLKRDPVEKNPFFARRQAGFNIGGPIKKNRVFFFAHYEHNNQDGVVALQPGVSEFTAFGGIFPNYFNGDQMGGRVDWHSGSRHNAFVRYSRDDNDGFTPPVTSGSFPSNWSKTGNTAHQSVISLTSIFRPTHVNELRFAFWRWNTANQPPSRTECPGDCLGFDLPQFQVLGGNFVIGNYVIVPQGGDFDRYSLADNFTWQKGKHQWRFGFEWTHERGSGFSTFLEPGDVMLYSPAAVRAHNADPSTAPEDYIRLPESFTTLDDILELPMMSVETAFGDPGFPAPYNYDRARQTTIWRFYFHNTWRVHRRFTLNYGLAYFYHADLANHDLSKPAFLAPFFGPDGLAATPIDKNNFGPSMGFSWSVTDDQRTVLRAGAGIYYNLPLAIDRLVERTVIGPAGEGRFPVKGSLIPNPFANVPGVPLFTPLDFTTGPTNFRGRHLMGVLPGVRSLLTDALSGLGDGTLATRNIDIFKQATLLVAGDFVHPYAEHLSIGVQRQIATDMVLSADVVYRHFIGGNTGDVDLNRWGSASGPVIPACVGVEAFEPDVHCSTGRIGVQMSAARSKYKGLLVRFDKRFSRGFQFLASYALSSNRGFNGVRNNDEWFESYGPLPGDRRHIFTASGLLELPANFRLSFISSVLSGAPYTAQLFGLDLNGDGTEDDALSGARWNSLNRGVGKRELRELVGRFNAQHAGTRTPRGQFIPEIILPAAYEFGDTVFSQDFRLGWRHRFHERIDLSVFGEVFNLLNVANLSGYTFNLLDPDAFGRPSSRVNQVFGSGGPRAFQLGARVSF